jgi:hypothetical protein
MSRTVDLLELVWTVIAVVGFVSSIGNVWAATGDRRLALMANTNGYGAAMLGYTLAQEVLRMIAEVGFVAAGAWAMTQPTPDPAPSTSPVAIVALVGANLVISANSVTTGYTRRRLAKIAQDQFEDTKGES